MSAPDGDIPPAPPLSEVLADAQAELLTPASPVDREVPGLDAGVPPPPSFADVMADGHGVEMGPWAAAIPDSEPAPAGAGLEISPGDEPVQSVGASSGPEGFDAETVEGTDDARGASAFGLDAESSPGEDAAYGAIASAGSDGFDASRAGESTSGDDSAQDAIAPALDAESSPGIGPGGFDAPGAGEPSSGDDSIASAWFDAESSPGEDAAYGAIASSGSGGSGSSSGDDLAHGAIASARTDSESSPADDAAAGAIASGGSDGFYAPGPGESTSGDDSPQPDGASPLDAVAGPVPDGALAESGAAGAPAESLPTDVDAPQGAVVSATSADTTGAPSVLDPTHPVGLSKRAPDASGPSAAGGAPSLAGPATTTAPSPLTASTEAAATVVDTADEGAPATLVAVDAPPDADPPSAGAALEFGSPPVDDVAAGDAALVAQSNEFAAGHAAAPSGATEPDAIAERDQHSAPSGEAPSATALVASPVDESASDVADASAEDIAESTIADVLDVAFAPAVEHPTLHRAELALARALAAESRAIEPAPKRPTVEPIDANVKIESHQIGDQTLVERAVPLRVREVAAADAVLGGVVDVAVDNAVASYVLGHGRRVSDQTLDEDLPPELVKLAAKKSQSVAPLSMREVVRSGPPQPAVDEAPATAKSEPPARRESPPATSTFPPAADASDAEFEGALGDLQEVDNPVAPPPKIVASVPDVVHTPIGHTLKFDEEPTQHDAQIPSMRRVRSPSIIGEAALPTAPVPEVESVGIAVSVKGFDADSKRPKAAVSRSMSAVEQSAPLPILGNETPEPVRQSSRPDPSAVQSLPEEPPGIDATSESPQMAGVDIGGRWVRVGVMAGGQVKLLRVDREPYYSSLVALGDDGRSVVVGEHALAVAEADPSRAVSIIELLRAVDQSPIAHPDARERVGRDPNGRYVATIGQRTFVLADVLRKFLKPIAPAISAQLGGGRPRVYMSIPNDLPDAATSLLQKAAEGAGLIAELISEPLAMIRAYEFAIAGLESILTVDLGATHLGVAVSRRGRDGFFVLDSRWDAKVSAEQLDEAVAELALNEVGLRLDAVGPQARRHIMAEVERARVDLRRDPMVNIDVPVPVAGERPRIETVAIPRSRIYQVTQSVTDEVIMAAGSALTTASIHPKAIGAVIVGGSAGAFPPLVGALTTMTGKEPLQSVLPSEVITLGLAEAADDRSDNAELKKAEGLVAAIGISLPGGRFKPLIVTGSKLPASHSRRYPTTRDGQTEVELTFYQGNTDLVSAASHLGTLALRDVTKAERGRVAVDVEVSLDVDAVMTVTLSEVYSGKKMRLVVPTQQTPSDRRSQLARRPSIEDLSGPARAKPKKGFFGRLFGR